MAISAPAEDPALAQGRRESAARARTERLYAEHARGVVAICRALLRNRTDAEDAAQQVFLSAHRALLNGSAPREPGAWLGTIARNECWARIRARMREPLAVGDVERADGLPDPVAEAIRRCDLQAFWAAIRELPRQQRDALLLRELGGLTYDELAVALAVSTPAVESLLFRARQRLRERLEAAYAAIGGSWPAGLARLIGASAPAAATKAAALGIGTATVATGAVVATPMLDHRPPVRRPAHTAVATPPRPHRAAVARVVLSTPAPTTSPPVVRHEDSRDHSSTSAGEDGHDGSSHDGPSHDASAPAQTAPTTTTTESSGDSGDGRDGGALATAPALLPTTDGRDSGGGDASSLSDGDGSSDG